MLVNAKYAPAVPAPDTEKTQFPGVRSAISGLRYYSPTLGRFINQDPIAESGGLNLYGFCGNNGVNRWDHLGMDWTDIYNWTGTADSSWEHYDDSDGGGYFDHSAQTIYHYGSGDNFVQQPEDFTDGNGHPIGGGSLFGDYVGPFDNYLSQDVTSYLMNQNAEFAAMEANNRNIFINATINGAANTGFNVTRGAGGGVTVSEQADGNEIVYQSAIDRDTGKLVVFVDTRAPNSGAQPTLVAQVPWGLLLEQPPVVPRPMIPPEILGGAQRMIPKNRVTLPDGRAIDIKGDSHFNKPNGPRIDPPHNHIPKPANPAPYNQFKPKFEQNVKPSTTQDILDAIQEFLFPGHPPVIQGPTAPNPVGPRTTIQNIMV